MLTKRLQRIDSFFDVVSNHLSFSSINPKNANKAKTAFFRQGKNPHFTYDQPDESLQGFRDILEELSFGDTPLETLFERKRKELMLKADMLMAIGKPSFSQKSKKLYPPPSERLVQQAYNLLRLPPSPPGKKIPRKEAVRLFRRAFNELGLRYRIKSVEMTTSAQMDASHRILELRKRERFDEDYVKRLVVHEIGTHALRTENGVLQPWRIFKNGFAHYLDTEEGLAAYNEFRAGVMSNSVLRNYAGRVIAVHYALSNDFTSTYKHLRKHFSQKMAWKLALRAKRGMRDTSRPGAYTKDCSYLRGFLDVLRFVKKNDVDSLYVGKVGIKDLPVLGEVAGLQKQRYVLGELLEKKLVEPSDRRIDQEEFLKMLQ